MERGMKVAVVGCGKGGEGLVAVYGSMVNQFRFLVGGQKRKRVPKAPSDRRKMRDALLMIQGVAFVVLLQTTWVNACSDFLLNTTLPEVVSARTMDYDVDLKTVLEVIPRGTVFHDPPVLECHDCPDLQWEVRYGFVALNIFGFSFASDGLNEKGLSVAVLYLPGTKYPTPDKSSAKPIVTSTCAYLMGNYATVAEVRDAVTNQIQIGQFDYRMEALFPSEGAASIGEIPLHLTIHDANGENLVLEYLNGTVNMYENINDVLTNEPPLDQQLQNLEANGLHHLPGGYGPTDRFVRISVLNHHVDALAYPQNKTFSTGTQEQQVISAAAHILQSVVRPIGEPTQWSLIRDHKRTKLYFQSTQNLVLRVVDLTKLHFDDVESRRAIPVTYGDWFVDETQALLDPSNHLQSKDLPRREEIEVLLNRIDRFPHRNAAINLAATKTVTASQVKSSVLSTVSLFVGGFGCGIGAMVWLNVIQRRNRRQGYASVGEEVLS